MRSNDRVRRSEEQERPDESRGEPPAPHLASILALQRTVGNRALQRLIYGTKSGRLTVPTELGEALYPWNSETGAWHTPEPEPTPVKKPRRPPVVKGRKAKTETEPEAATDEKPDAPVQQPVVPRERTYETLINTDAQFRERIRKGMALTSLTSMVTMPADQIDTAVDTHLLGEKPAEGTADALKAVAKHHRQLLHQAPTAKYTSPDQVKPAWMVTDPRALIAGAPDLGLATDDLLTTDVPKKPGTKQWAYACVLIALAKLDDSFTKTKSITKAEPDSLESAVQALHKYYVEKEVQYDDSATRFQLMQQWGYTPIWVGNAAWIDLAAHVALPKGETYIFDIEGHTLVVKTKQAIKSSLGKLTRRGDFFEHWSDPRNYSSEMAFGRSVLNIWKKK